MIFLSIFFKGWAFEKPIVYLLAFGSPCFIGFGLCLRKGVEAGTNSPWAILCLFTSGFVGFSALYFLNLGIQKPQSISFFGYIFISIIFIFVSIGWWRLYSLSQKKLTAQSESKPIFLIGFAIAICILFLAKYKVIGI